MVRIPSTAGVRTILLTRAEIIGRNVTLSSNPKDKLCFDLDRKPKPTHECSAGEADCSSYADLPVPLVEVSCVR